MFLLDHSALDESPIVVCGNIFRSTAPGVTFSNILANAPNSIMVYSGQGVVAKNQSDFRSKKVLPFHFLFFSD